MQNDHRVDQSEHLVRPLSQMEVRDIDRQAIEEFGLPGVVLMENAGRGCADIINQRWNRGRCIICCGPGNNGGDGFVIARHIQNSGWDVHIRLATPVESVRGDAAVFLANALKSAIPVRTVMIREGSRSADHFGVPLDEFQSELKGADLIVDAVLGTGLSGEVRSPYREIIQAINTAERPVLAIDLPSGMECNTGLPLGICVKATRTATMVSSKLGYKNVRSFEWTGPIDIVDIGIPLLLKKRIDLDQSS